jgi:ABC-type transport system substrate-binding protein
MKQPKMGWILIVIVGLLSVTTQAQGVGVVREGGWRGGEAGFNPYTCSETICERLTALLYPTLYATDPQNGAIISASDDSFGLVTSPFDPSASVQTLTLRDDMRWSDGKSVTAYDVFYSVLADAAFFDVYSRDIQALRVLDEQTLEVQFYRADCSVPSRINLPIVPAHVYDPNFKTIVDGFDFSGDMLIRLNAFLREAYSLSRFSVLDQAGVSISGNRFEFEAIRPNLDLRLLTPDKQTAYVSVYPSFDSPQDVLVQQFLEGETNLLVNPPLNRRADIIQDERVRVDEYAGRRQVVMILNTANPSNPLSAFDKDGNLRDQGNHPYFGDTRVRQAMQKAINVQELIDGALLGDGTPIASFQNPSSWGFNPDLQAVLQNTTEAKRLLTEAGWRDVGSDGVRECVDCLYAQQGISFTIRLEFDANDEMLAVTAQLITQQLLAVGIATQLGGSSGSQSLDAYLTIMDGLIDPDPSRYLSRLADNAVLGNGNIGSFYDAEIEELMTTANQVASCSVADRAPYYRELDVLLQNAQPMIWLFAPNDFVVSRGILGIAPMAFDPLWNITDWKVQS